MRYTISALALGVIALPSLVQAETPAERGRYLVETIAACGNCHTPMGPNGPMLDRYLAGGLLIRDAGMEAVSSNITPDRATGIGAWSDAEIARAIREGVRPDGTIIGPPMPFGFYRQLADADVEAIVALLRTVPAVESRPEPSHYGFPLPPAWGPPVGHVTAPDRADKVAWGAYLAGPVGHCLECHMPMLPDGRRELDGKLGWGGAEFVGPWGVTVSADLTPTNLGDWTDDDIVLAITQGIARDGRPLAPPMGFAYYNGIRADDLDAIVAFLRTLSPSAP